MQKWLLDIWHLRVLRLDGRIHDLWREHVRWYHLHDMRVDVGSVWILLLLLGMLLELLCKGLLRGGLIRQRWIVVCNSHSGTNGARDICLEASVELQRVGMEVCRESPVLGRQVLVFFFVHFFIDDILFRDAKASASAFLVDFRSASGRLQASFQAAITSSRSCDIGSILGLVRRGNGRRSEMRATNLSWFSS